MKKERYLKYFENKKITVMGIGLLGRGVGDIKFLAENNAKIIATDLKTKKELKKSLDKLKKFKNIKYRLNKHLLDDFKNRDLILKGNGIPLENKYIEFAKKNKVDIKMSLALVFDILKKEKIETIFVGVTGSKGKSTTVALIQKIFEVSKIKYHLAGNIRNLANLPLLKKIKNGDIILAELDSWQLQGFHQVKKSPNIAVFTNFFEDHLDYYKGSMKKYFYDKSAIFRYQKKDDLLILPNQAKTSINNYWKKEIKAKIMPAVFSKKIKNLDYSIFGRHNEKNIAAAYQVALALKIDEKLIFKGICNFKPPEGRFEFIQEKKGILYYNDNNSTTPNSTLLSLQSLKKKYPKKNIILIAGGCDKNFNFSELSLYIKKNIFFNILFYGSATEKIKKNITNFIEVESMKKAVQQTENKAKKGDIVILSPAASSFGIFTNEYQRSDLFLKYIKNKK